MDVTLVLASSILLQFAAAALAFRLVRITERRLAWILMAVAILLMAIRRCITFSGLLSGTLLRPPEFAAELVALTISVLIAVGLYFVSPLVLNIPESKQKLRERDEQVQLMLRSTAEAIYGLDLEGNCTFCNPAGVRFLGYDTDEELIGKNMHNLIHHTRADGSEYPADECTIYEAFRRGERIHHDDELLWRKDGSSFPVEFWSDPIHRDGKPIGAIITFLDITERKQAQREKQEQELILRGVLSSMLNPLLNVDVFGTIQLASNSVEKVFGWSPQELVGRNIKLLMPEPYRSEHDGYMSEYRKTGKTNIVGQIREFPAERKDGSQFPCELTVWLVNLPGQKEPLLTGVIRDLTERKQAEEDREELIRDLEAKNAELERFTYTASHDLKSPLVTIKGFLGILEQDLADGKTDAVEDDISEISSAADKMKRLLDELLELSRIGRVANLSEEVSLTEVTQEALELLAGNISERGVTVEIISELPIVWGDRIRLLEVMQNLIDNAVKFSSEHNPRVEIGAKHEGEKTICFVRDNGVGIDPKYQDRIFDLFEQLDAGSAGTGIGLALVKRIIEFHGGRIWEESAGLGKGCTFFFSLPQRKHSGIMKPVLS